MWARVIEFMLAIWLALSPFILRYPSHETFFWINDLVCACLVALFALVSFWYPLRKIHLLTIGIALWLWSLGYSNFPEQTSPPLENSVVIGLLLLILAIVPSHASLPSHSWQEFMKRK
ncbi:MAG: hypothetical protein Q8L98_01670 [Chlamydiales bacterium]|nr:hypothetical protein [Chlamydiales bacterium]